ncbi:hypothetical protein [Sulfurimonas sp. CS5]|uniref:hypothetical protein n=1 Tax=Sulfurimonas sp. CS5 TaxID=3391145 RepID=UPI0039E9ADE9
MPPNKLKRGLLVPLILTTLAFAAQNDTLTTTTKTKTDKHIFDAYIKVGLGYDSNPYYTPDKSYNDYTASGGGALVNPDVKSGVFIPISLKADYEYRLKQNIRLLGDFKLKARKFTDSSLSNADETKTQARAGVRFRLNKYKKEIDKIEFKVFAADIDKTYVDHDDGSAKRTVGGDQSNRYKYKKIGAELEYTYDFKKLDLFFRAMYEDRDYGTPATWSSLDHTYMKLKAQAGYQLSKALHLQGYYQYSVRDYKERKSYEIVGTNINLVNPGVNLTYNDIKLSADYKVSKKYKIKFDYLLSQRKDDNKGYSDYLYSSITLSNKYKFSKKLRASLKLKYHKYNYENAYAYDTSTTQSKKESDGYKISINANYKLSKNWATSLNLDYRDMSATDKRYEYKQTVAMINMKYIF